MNAWLGIYVRKSEREAIFSPIAPRLRSWGNETFAEEGPQYFEAPGLDGVCFRFGPVQNHVRKYLPQAESDLEYGDISGLVFDSYEDWVWMADVNTDDDAEEVGADAVAKLSRFEAEMKAVLNRLGFWALTLVPDSERRETFVTVDADAALKLLRRGVSNWATCEGFLATGLPRAEQATGAPSA